MIFPYKYYLPTTRDISSSISSLFPACYGASSSQRTLNPSLLDFSSTPSASSLRLWPSGKCWLLIMLSRTDLCLLQSVVAQPHHSPHQVQLGHGDHQLAWQSRLQPGDGTGPEEDSRPDRESKQDRTVEVRGPLVNLVSTT